jgi:elongation factor Ts
MSRKIPLETIKALREKTGAPLGDVRSALESAGGDEAKASELLKRKGFEAAVKRQGRAADMGRIEAYVHHDGRLAALVEVNCETDFVARLPEFQQFCRDLAMQVASQNPLCVRKEELSTPQFQEATQMGKGSEEFAREACLLEQLFIKDQGQTILQYLTSLIAKTGENIVVRRFKRFALGEPQTSQN